jgi:hypothetical protein
MSTRSARLSRTAIAPSARCPCSGVVAPVITSAPSIPAFAATARSVSTRSPTSSARPGPSRSSAAWTIAGDGLPTFYATTPAAVSTAATTAPVPGQAPSGIGKKGSRPAVTRVAPRIAAWAASRSSA